MLNFNQLQSEAPKLDEKYTVYGNEIKTAATRVAEAAEDLMNFWDEKDQFENIVDVAQSVEADLESAGYPEKTRLEWRQKVIVYLQNLLEDED